MPKFLFPILLFLITSCAPNTAGQVNIDAAQTIQLLKNEAEIQLVDVRTPAELHQTGKIEGAQNINFSSPNFQQLIGQLDKNKPVIVYCAAGSRSPRAATLMVKWGFPKVYDYTGGINDWLAKGHKTVQ